MWAVYEHPRLDKRLKKLPIEILKRYEKWKDIVRMSDSKGLRMIKGFHDESLKGNWAGYRSSRLGLQYRVIYEIKGDEIYVAVLDITAHDYRRR